MRSPNSRRLESLLAQDPTPLVERSLFALREAKSVLEPSTGPLPIQHVRRVYTRRARLNTRNQAGVQGFSRLIKNLNSTPEKQIEIYAIRSGDEIFSVFTNPSITSLIGVLVSKTDFT